MTVFWVVDLLSNLFLINLGLRNFELSVFIPIYNVLGVVLTIVAGMLYYKTFNNFKHGGDVAGFASGLGVLVLGLFLTSKREHRSKTEIQEEFDHLLEDYGLEDVVMSNLTDESMYRRMNSQGSITEL